MHRLSSSLSSRHVSTFVGQTLRLEDQQARLLEKLRPQHLSSTTDPVVAALRTCALFSADHYLVSHADLAEANVDPASHFAATGAHEQRNPSPWFETRWYLSQLQEPLAEGVNPLLHYVETGWRQELDPHPFFSVGYYLASNPDIREADIEPLTHFMQTGWREGRNAHPLVPTAHYLDQVGGLEMATIDPISFYVRFGGVFNLSPHPFLDRDWIVRQHGLADGGIDPLIYYFYNGHKPEVSPSALIDPPYLLRQIGFQPSGKLFVLDYMMASDSLPDLSPSPLFLPNFYRQQLQDGSLTGHRLLEHYLSIGWRKLLSPHPLFDVDHYAESAGELPGQWEPVSHYRSFGAKAGFSPLPDFNHDFYVAQTDKSARAVGFPLGHYVETGEAKGLAPNPDFDPTFYLWRHSDVAAARIGALHHYTVSGRAERRQTKSRVEMKRLMAKRRVAILSGEPDFVGHRYRVTRLAEAAISAGYHAHITTAEEAVKDLSFLIDSAMLVIWRAPWSEKLAWIVTIAKDNGVKIVFDCDDLMFDPSIANAKVIDAIRSEGFDAAAIADSYDKMRTTLLHCDACIAPTKPLLRAMVGHGKPTYLLPNGFDASVHRASAAALAKRANTVSDGLIRIGYASGTKTHQRDFAIAVPAIAAVMRRRKAVRLVLFNGKVDLSEFPSLLKLADRIEWRDPVPLAELPDELARFDINIAPIEAGNVFCEAKSELKYFEAALVRVPTLASPTEPFREAITDGVTGCVVENDQWEEKLLELIDDVERRMSMGQRAAEHVLWRYGPERRTELVSRIFGALLGSNRESAASAALLAIESRPWAAPEINVPTATVRFDTGQRAASDVAVIMPVYNYGHFVEAALDSLTDQTLAGFDVVVVEDRSPDDSLAVILRWAEKHHARFNRLTVLQNDVNSKLGPTRNVAYRFTNARYIMPLDADNMLLPRCLKACRDALEASGAAAVFPKIRQFGDTQHLMGDAPWDAALLARGNYIDAMAMIRKAAWVAVNGYEVRNGWEDYDLWMKFIERGLYAMQVPEELALYRVHASSMIRTETAAKDIYARLLKTMATHHPWNTI